MVSNHSKLQLAPSTNLCKLLCQAKALLLLKAQEGKMSASKLIYYFSIHPAAFRFQASLLPDNITLNPANRRTDQSLSDFQTGIGMAAHATLETEQLISNTRTVLVDSIGSLQGFD